MAPSRLPSRPSRIPTATRGLFKLDPPPMGEPIRLQQQQQPTDQSDGAYEGHFRVTNEDRLGRPVLLKVRLSRALADTYRCRVTPHYARLQPGQAMQFCLTMKETPDNCVGFTERVQVLGQADFDGSPTDLSASILWKTSGKLQIETALCKVVFKSPFAIYEGPPLRPSVLEKNKDSSSSTVGELNVNQTLPSYNSTLENHVIYKTTPIQGEEEQIEPEQDMSVLQPCDVLLPNDTFDHRTPKLHHAKTGRASKTPEKDAIFNKSAFNPEVFNATAPSWETFNESDSSDEPLDTTAPGLEAFNESASSEEPLDTTAPGFDALNESVSSEELLDTTASSLKGFKKSTSSEQACSETVSNQEACNKSPSNPDAYLSNGPSVDRPFRNDLRPSPNIAGLKTSLLRKDLGLVQAQMTLNDTRNGSFFEELKDKQERLEQKLTKAKAALKEKTQKRMQQGAVSPTSPRPGRLFDEDHLLEVDILQDNERSQDGTLERTTAREMSLTPPVSSASRISRPTSPDEASLIAAATKIADLEEKIASQSKLLTQRDEKVLELQLLLKARDRLLSEKVRIIADMNDQLGAKDEQISAELCLLEEKDGLLEEREKNLDDRDEVIKLMEQDIKGMKQNITDLKIVLEATEKIKAGAVKEIERMKDKYMKAKERIVTLRETERDLQQKLDRERESGRLQTDEVLDQIDQTERMRKALEELEKRQGRDKRDEQDGGMQVARISRREPDRVATRAFNRFTVAGLLFLAMLVGAFFGRMNLASVMN